MAHTAKREAWQDRGNAHLPEIFQRALAPFAPPPVHQMSRESTGCGLDGETTAVCSCGWKGHPVSQASDFHSTELANQENQHRMSGVSVDELREAGKL
jgi:hypothetical protein